jgi:hypothetical protein
MAPDKAEQLVLVFFIVILIVKATPVLSRRISDLTNEEGVMVGKGPAVSVGDTVQVPEPELPPELLPELLLATESFLQASRIIGTEAAPIRKFFRNFFLDCSIAVTF